MRVHWILRGYFATGALKAAVWKINQNLEPASRIERKPRRTWSTSFPRASGDAAAILQDFQQRNQIFVAWRRIIFINSGKRLVSYYIPNIE